MAQVFSLDKIHFHFSEKELFSDASLSVADSEKVGVVGLNGSGKSTLLKLIAGIETPDLGALSIRNGITLSYLTQVPMLSPERSILSETLALSNITDEEKAYEAKAMLTRLGFTDLSIPCGKLSGGQQKRVVLASVLLNPGDLLLLDEPTNHIDSDMIEWLEAWLKKYRGTLVMVTHDRYFLDRVCGRILEVTGGKIESYNANYEGYLLQKAEREEMTQATLSKNKSLYRTELKWIQRGARARSTKAKGRIEQFETLAEAVKEEKGAAPIQIASVSSRLGKKILVCDSIAKSLSGHLLLKDFTYTLLRDDRIGIIGRNGAGKTTLLNMLSGDLAPDSGRIERGETLRIGYFKQHFPPMDKNVKLIDAARNVAARVHTPDGDWTAGQMLERFLFPSAMHSQEVARLSGGEKRRLYLLQVLLTAPNLLLLDEPTNDLDIETLTVLEDYLDSFQGAVITVTHDRFFLDRVTKRLFVLEEGTLSPYEGGYASYLSQKKEAEPQPRQVKEAKPKEPPRQNEKTRFTFKEQRDFETIEGTIGELEACLEQIQKDLEAFSSDYLKVQALMEKQAQTEQALYAAMDRFVYLQDLYETFKKEP